METAYEAIYIIDTTLSEEQESVIVEKYRDVVTRAGGIVDDIDRWDPRRLAYEIKGRREGVYMIMNFRSEPTAKNELDRIYRISDDVIRHMIVKQDRRAERFPSRVRQAEQERREREMAARLAANPPAPQPVLEPQPVTDLPPAASQMSDGEPAEHPIPANSVETPTPVEPSTPDAAATEQTTDTETP